MKSLITLFKSRTLVYSLGMSTILGGSILLVQADEPISLLDKSVIDEQDKQSKNSFWQSTFIKPIQFNSKVQVKPKTTTGYSSAQQDESTLDGMGRWVKRHLPGSGEEDNSNKEKDDRDRQTRDRSKRGTEAPIANSTNAIPAQSVSSPSFASPTVPSDSSVMKELEKLYEQNGAPAPEFHPMLEPQAKPAITSRSGKISRRDSKFLSRFGIPPGTPVDTTLPTKPAYTPAVQQPVVVQQPQSIPQPIPQNSPITVQINLQPTPVGNVIPPQSIQYQMPTNGTMAPVTVPIPMHVQQPLSTPNPGKSTVAKSGKEKEYFPNDGREIHDSESDEFFFNGDTDDDEKMEIVEAPTAVKNIAQPVAESAGKFPVDDETPKQEMQYSDPALNTKPVEEDKPILEAGENPFGFPTAGIKEANKKLADDNWVNNMKKSPISGIEAKTVSSTKAEPNLITSKDFEKNKLETPADRRLRLIRERQGQTGLKGFCPVVLRDQRELVDSSLEYRVQYDGKSYHVSSAEAQAKFLADSARYAPANQGNDIVQQHKSGAREEGSLDHALWFGGKLYLFATQENQNEFAQQPKKYIK